MGQPIIVTEKPSIAHPGMVRFETNRALTGMGHERYETRESARGQRPPDELARRLFDHGGVEAVHVNGNIVTVDLEKGRSSEGMAQIVHDLYLFYPGADAADGAVTPPEPTVGADSDAIDALPDDAVEAAVEAEDAAEPAPRLSNALASTSLVFGILGQTILPVLGAVVALVTGSMALGRIKRGTAEGRGMAIVGVLLGVVVVLEVIALALYLALR